MTSNSDIATVKEWLMKQAHLPKDLDDKIIAKFLHCCDNSLEKTKSTIDLFFCLRADTPEFFCNRDPQDEKIQNIFKLIDFVPLPKRTAEGYRLFLYRLADTDPDKFSFVDYVKTFFMIGETRLRKETEKVEGEVPIFDMTGYSLRHLTRIPLPLLRKYMQYSQEAHPVKLMQIHIINAVPLLDKVLTLIRPFMKSEVAAMLHVHLPGSTTLYNFIPQELLPEEYGGQMGPVNDITRSWKKIVEDEQEWFLRTSWIADESKRMSKKIGIQKMEGSFRSLVID
uniref:CRAL-TRIO domain-containing protein n=1 Tax=Clastoptera arizonana TaxID=38151 RepID=A0A1B6DYJ3_9HEMI